MIPPRIRQDLKGKYPNCELFTFHITKGMEVKQMEITFLQVFQSRGG